LTLNFISPYHFSFSSLTYLCSLHKCFITSERKWILSIGESSLIFRSPQTIRTTEETKICIFPLILVFLIAFPITGPFHLLTGKWNFYSPLLSAHHVYSPVSCPYRGTLERTWLLRKNIRSWILTLAFISYLILEKFSEPQLSHT